MIELTYEPLSPARCMDAVRAPGSGGIVVFTGCVRDFSEGQTVHKLEYEAYEPMAMQALEQVVEEVRSRWPINRIAVQHRLGELAVGEDAVVVAVACPHRGEAFEACRYAIDRLKEVVPLWKKEHGENGQAWVGSVATSTDPSNHDPRPG